MKELPKDIIKYYIEKNIVIISFSEHGVFSNKINVFRQDGYSDKWLVSDKKCEIIKSGFGVPNPKNQHSPYVLSFRYVGANNDNNPKLLFFGHYQHAETGNTIIYGINLNYLTNEQRNGLFAHLNEILDNEPGDRFDACKKILPEIIEDGYRSYNESFMRNTVTEGWRK